MFGLKNLKVIYKLNKKSTKKLLTPEESTSKNSHLSHMWVLCTTVRVEKFKQSTSLKKVYC